MNAGQPTVVCLGFFDGVHRGHCALVRAARQIGDAQGLPVWVHTFDRVPGDKGEALTSLAKREQLLLREGADRVIASAFNAGFCRMPGDVFFHTVLVSQMHACHVVCGADHRFGYLGACGVEELRQLCMQDGIGLTVVPEVLLKSGQRISSSAVRDALSKGEWTLAEEMLGRPLSEMDEWQRHTASCMNREQGGPV